MKRHKGNVNTNYKVCETNLKGLHTIWFQLFNLLGKAKLLQTVNKSVVARNWSGQGEIIRGSIKDFLGLGKYSVWDAAAAAKLLQLYPTPCDPIDGSPPDSTIPGILQARTLEWVAISFSNACMHAKSLQLCPTLCNPMDSSPPGSSGDSLGKSNGVGCQHLSKPIGCTSQKWTLI